jgi:hypothetical protein
MSLKGVGILTIIVSFIAVSAAVFFQPGEVNLPVFQGIEWEERVKVASGDARMGPWRMNDSEFHLVDDPAVSLNDNGEAAVAWADLEKQEIMLQIFESNGRKRFDEPVRVPSDDGVFSWLPRVLISSGGERIYILWQEIVFSGGSHGGEIFFAHSGDGGQTFSGPQNLSNTEAGAGKGRFTTQRWFNGSLDLAKNEDGHIFTVWTEYEGPLWFSRSEDRGDTFHSPQLISGSDEDPARAPSVATGASGKIILVWAQGEGDQSDIYYVISEDQGETFSEPKIIHQNSSHSDAPRIAADPAGMAHVVYSESEDGLWGGYHIRYTQLHPETGEFSGSKIISGPGSGQIASSAYPSLRLDEKGRVFVLWELFPSLGRRPQGLGFTISEDGGQTFKTPGVVPGSVDPALGFNGGRQGLFMNKLDVNNRGEVSVVNSTFNQADSSYIWLFRGQLRD